MSISISLGELIASVSDNSDERYDCLIIGSGYGGAVAAHTFSGYRNADGQALKIAVLERGKEYSPGSFPTGLNEAIGTFAKPGDNHWGSAQDGLYSVRSDDTHWILAGNGVGGGSLINAGVMLAPNKTSLEDDAWPEEARDVLSNKAYMDTVGLMLGSRLPSDEFGSIANTVENAKVETNKYRSIASLGGEDCALTPTPLSIRLSDAEPNQAIVTSPCIKCGNCFSGCNFNAKKSLDTNLLAEAKHNGVTIVNGAETLFFEKQDSGWAVHVVYSSEKLRTTQIEPLKLYCDHLVISAGSIGSTELLLRSQYKAQRNGVSATMFSTALGKRFYGNGDTISSIVGRSQPVTMISNDATTDAEREIGPTNSGMLDMRADPNQGLVLQELAVPGALQRVIIEFISFTQVRDALTSFKCGLERRSSQFLGLTKDDVDSMTVVAGIGGDRSRGTITPKYPEQTDTPALAANYYKWLPDVEIGFSDVESDIAWKSHRTKVLDLLNKLRSKNDPPSMVFENPMESPLGDKIRQLFGMEAEKSSETKGRLMSVHPLGGCAMADSVETGVVNVHGQVYKSDDSRNDAANTTEVYDDLAIVDGAIVPLPTDVNPALTIAALALNASTNLAKKWDWKPVTLPPPEPKERKAYRQITAEHRQRIHPTGLTLAERLVGTVWLETEQGAKEYVAELRLRSEPFQVDQFAKGETLTIDLLKNETEDCANKLPNQSILRLFRKEQWDSFLDANSILKRRKDQFESGRKSEWIAKQRLFLQFSETELDDLSELTVPLTGKISVFEEVSTNMFRRFFRGCCAWFLNRGLRDICQPNQAKRSFAYFVQSLARAPSVFLHSGRERQFLYSLQTGEPTKNTLSSFDTAVWTNQPVVGRKRFFYDRHSNPVNQLMSIELSQFPGLDFSRSKTLNVDLEYFANVQVPLFQIHKESDAVTGYADLIALGLWFSRVFLLHYFWILRKPDLPSEFPKKTQPVERNTKPEALPGLASGFKVIELPVEDAKNKYEGETIIRLSRFRGLVDVCARDIVWRTG